MLNGQAWRPALRQRRRGNRWARRRRQRGGAAKINYHRGVARNGINKRRENGGVSAHQPKAADEENNHRK
jgi:hypothetical protein